MLTAGFLIRRLFIERELKRLTQLLGGDMNAEEAKFKNILDMAVNFTAMTRVFESGSTEKIRICLGIRY
jgi:hypothetical protein